MVFSGYLNLGGREIVNGGRTSAYVATMLPNLDMAGCHDCDGLYEVLGDKVYTSPLVDQPSWFDADNPDTWDFYGLYPLAFEGFENGTTKASVTEFIYDGAAISPPRRTSRSLRISGLLIGLTPEAVSAGMTWLRQVLRPGECGVNRACAGDHLTYFVACPPLCEDSPDIVDPPTGGTELRECATGAVVGPISACALPYERHLYNSVCVDGPRIVDEYDPTCGAMVRVEFTIVAGTPSPFGTGRQITDIPVDPASLPTVPDRTCGDDDLSEILARTNLALDPGPVDASWPVPPTTGAWGSSSSLAWNAVWDTTVVHTPGGRSVKTERTGASTGSPSWIGSIQRIGAWMDDSGGSVGETTLPSIVPGLTHTASLWMRTTYKEAIGVVWLTYYDAAGVSLGQVSGAPTDPIPVGAWKQVHVTFTPPLGADTVRIYARLETADGTTVVHAPTSNAWFTEALLEVSLGPRKYFDGNTVSADPSITYDWIGDEGHSPSRMVQIMDPGPILDPDCPPVPDPPRPPVIVESCVVPVDSYKRFTVEIPSDVVPRWSDLVPIVSLTTAAAPVRQLRVRFYPNPYELPQYDLEQCQYIGEFIVSYIPPNSTMIIDGTAQDVIVVGQTGLPQAASHLLYGSGGGPMTWPYMSCGSRYDLSIDVYPDVAGLEFELCVAARE